MSPFAQPRPEFQAFWGATRLSGPIPPLSPRERAVSILISGMPADLSEEVREAFLRSSATALSRTPAALQGVQRQRPGSEALENKLKALRACIVAELAVTRRALAAPAWSMSRMTRNIMLVLQGAELRRLFWSLAAALGDPAAALAEFRQHLAGGSGLKWAIALRRIMSFSFSTRTRRQAFADFNRR